MRVPSTVQLHACMHACLVRGPISSARTCGKNYVKLAQCERVIATRRHCRREGVVAATPTWPSAKREPGTAITVEGVKYEKVPLEGGGFERRRVGAKQWKFHCEHGRRKENCKERGGSSVCEHGRQHRTCKECSGAPICEEGWSTQHVQGTCGGEEVQYEHGRRRRPCKEHGGSSVYEHGRQPMPQVKECRGSWN